MIGGGVRAKPDYIRFGILSPDEIESMAVMEVKKAQTLDANREIVKDGLYDLRMGPMSNNRQCETCHNDVHNCPGHFGYINLAEPIFHPFCDVILVKILNCVCHNCKRLLLDPHDRKNENKWKELLKIRNASDRLDALEEYSNAIKKCEGSDDSLLMGNLLEMTQDNVNTGRRGCNAQKQKVIKDTSNPGVLTIKRLGPNKNDFKILDPNQVLDILTEISDEDVRYMGLDPEYTHPRNFILRKLPIIPTCARSSVQIDSMNSSPDDLTHILALIINCNNRIKQAHTSRVAATKETSEEIDNLRKLIHLYIDNNDTRYMLRDTQNRVLKGINQQIKSKTGLIRLNLMGKRLDFTARTVISGDPTISIEQVGVPESVAKTMTYEEVVTDYNIEELRNMVQRGDDWPGAKAICKAGDDKWIDLAIARNSNQFPDIQSLVQKGDKVERHMKDGDFVLFNRQPTLHKVSIMGHRVKVMKYSTFRLNLSVTTPYNADFDGDEMNLHLPQGHAARAEIKNLMLVPENVVVSQMNAPIIGIVQDSLLACYLMTRRNVFIERNDVMNFMMWLDEWNGNLPKPAILYPKQLWTGKQMFSTIIPEGVNMEGFHPSHNSADKSFNPADDTHVYIRRGQLHMGMLSGSQLGSGKRGIIHVTWLDIGPNATKEFINGIQRITMNWLLLNGFSVGIGDMVPSERVKTQVSEIISRAITDTDALFYEACQGNIKRSPGQTPYDAFEVEVQKMLRNTGSKNGKVIKETIHSLNNIRSMVISGSKGSELNLAQIIGCLGQQSLMGGRIPFKFLSHRALPHFPAYDYSAPAKGYVQSSYLIGLKPTEFFFHAIGGREGVIDTAVKTADIGYTYQKMVKSLEDIVIEYDGTARRGEGEIVQLLFGDDGIDSIYMEMESLDWMLLSDRDYEKHYRLRIIDTDNIIYPAINRSFVSGNGDENEMFRENEFDLVRNINSNERENIENSDETIRNLLENEDIILDEKDLEWENDKDYELFLDTDYKFTKGVEMGQIVPMKRLEHEDIVYNFGEEWLDANIVSEIKSSPYEQKIVERYYQRLYKLREDYRASIENGSQSVIVGNLYNDNTIALPMSIKRILTNVQISNNINSNDVCRLSPSECVRKVLSLVNRITELGMRNYRNERFVTEGEDVIKSERDELTDSTNREKEQSEDTVEDEDYDKKHHLNHNKNKDFVKRERNAGSGILDDNNEFIDLDGSDSRNSNVSYNDEDDFDYANPSEFKKRESKRLKKFKKLYKCGPHDINKPTLLFTLHLMHLLSPKQLCYIRRFNHEALQDVINIILKKYSKSQVTPGEAVGIIAAESIAQPMTQMTLNTFHSAGVANATVTQGLPRLKEIIGAVDKIKTPSCTLKVTHGMQVERGMATLNQNQQINFKPSSGLYYDTGIKISGNLIKPDGTMDPENQAKYIQGSLSFTTVSSVEHRRMVIYDPWECNRNDPKYIAYLDTLDKIIRERRIKKQPLSDKEFKYYKNLRSIFDVDSQIIRLATNTGDGLPNEVLRIGMLSGREAADNYDDDNDSNSESNTETERLAEKASRSSLDSFTSPWVIRFEMNKDKMQGRGFRTIDIKRAIESFERRAHERKSIPIKQALASGDQSIISVWKYITLYIQTSTDNSDKIVIRLRPRLKEKYINAAIKNDFPALVNKACKLVKDKDDDSDAVAKCLNDESLDKLKDVPFDFDIPFLKIFAERAGGHKKFLHDETDHPCVLLASEISKIYVCGIQDINAAYIRRQENNYSIDRESNAITKSDQWYVDTEGATVSSFKLLMRLWGIDWTKTMCNDPHVICETLGIEAARTLILNELKTVMQGASYVNGRHLKLIAEIMTAAGTLHSVDRNGLFKRDNLVLMKSSFEKPLITLLNAGFYSQVDKLCGMSEALMTGNIIPVGTGRVSTLLNMDAENLGGVEPEENEEMGENINIGPEPTVREGTVGPDVTPGFGNFMTPRGNSIFSSRAEISPGSTKFYDAGISFELSPVRDNSISRQLSRTIETGLSTMSNISITGLSMRTSTSVSSLRKLSSFSNLLSRSQNLVSSQSNINQLSNSRTYNDGQQDSTSPSTGQSPTGSGLIEDMSPTEEFNNDSDDHGDDQSDEGSDSVDKLF